MGRVMGAKGGACLMDSMRGLQGRHPVSATRASSSSQPLSQYM
jgi:hypothetical protein